jgi:hypothetical protein
MKSSSKTRKKGKEANEKGIEVYVD